MLSTRQLYRSNNQPASYAALTQFAPEPFRRRERAMQRFRSMKTLQKFSSVHAQVQNHFNQERHLITRQVYKQRRSIALAEWRALAA
jgi:transposase-like protein